MLTPGARGRRRSYRDAVEELASAQKSGAGDPAYLRWVNRGLGRRAAAGAFVLGGTPNAVTALSAMASLAALVVIVAFPPSVASALSASALLLAGYALDSADGQLARLTGSGSVAGEWLDHVVDAARLPLFHVAIAAHFFRWSEGPPWLVAVALAFALLSSVWFFAQTLADKLSPAGPPASAAATWVSFAKLPYDVGVLYIAVAVMFVPSAFAALYTSIFAITALVALASLGRKYTALAAGPVTVPLDDPTPGRP